MLDVSKGLAPNWMQSAVPVLLTIIGLGVVFAIFWAIFQNQHIFLEKLARKDVARGLITFLIAISTVGIAIILAVSTVVSDSTPEDDKRFDRSKQVLTILIGVLGTIVGFYFGATEGDAPPRVSLQMPNATAGELYAAPMPLIEHITPPVRWSVDPTLPAGLALDPASGAVRGIPTAKTGKATYTFSATDSASPAHALQKVVDFEVLSAPAVAPATAESQPKPEITAPQAGATR